MNSQSEQQHWSHKWEDDTAAVLAEQDSVQAEIDFTMRNGDLLGAATASFDHVITSMELGDRKEAAAYALVGVMFSQANWMIEEKERHDSIVFDMPQWVHRRNDKDYGQTREIDKYGRNVGIFYRGENFYTRVSRIDAIESGVAGVEAVLLEGPEVDAAVKNEAIRDAVHAVCEHYFSLETDDNHVGDRHERHSAFKLAKELTDHIEIDGGEESNKAAFESYDMLALAAINSKQSQVFGMFNAPLRGLEELEIMAPELGDDIEQSISLIKRAKISKAAFTALLPATNMVIQVANTGTSFPPFKSVSAFGYTRENAADIYEGYYRNEDAMQQWLDANGLRLETAETDYTERAQISALVY